MRDGCNVTCFPGVFAQNCTMDVRSLTCFYLCVCFLGGCFRYQLAQRWVPDNDSTKYAGFLLNLFETITDRDGQIRNLVMSESGRGYDISSSSACMDGHFALFLPHGHTMLSRNTTGSSYVSIARKKCMNMMNSFMEHTGIYLPTFRSRSKIA